MRRLFLSSALSASWLLAGCTLLVDGRLEKPADGEDGAEAGTDAAPDEDAGSEQDDAGGPSDAGTGQPSNEAGSLDSGSGEPPRDAALGQDGAQALAQDVQVCFGWDHACAVNKLGKMICWGANAEDQTKFPTDRTYRRVACGDYHSCALDTLGRLVCVGRNRDNQRVVEQGPFSEVVAGDAHTCVLDAAGAARCFGLDSGGQSTPPAVALRGLTAGTGFTCGIRSADARVQCWGFGAAELTNLVSDTSFASIEAATDYLCGVTEAGAVRCWGHNQPASPGSVLKVSAGGYGACALLADRSVRCWAGNDMSMPFADKAPFRDVIVGGKGRCLLPEQGAILCEPEAPLSSVSPGPANFD